MTGTGDRLLVVDDEPFIADLLTSSLTFAGFRVDSVATGTEALAAVAALQPDLIVLDVQLPDLDGFEVTRELRGRGVNTPVLFLTARDPTPDKVRGLTQGGDDYVTKPFALDEVVARIAAILRRSRAEAVTPVIDNVLRFADLVLDQDRHQVYRGERPVHLSRTEFALLRYLMLNAGRVVSKAQILDHVWEYDFGGDGSIVESYVSFLRKKIDNVDPRLIHTIRGVGYTLRLPEPA
jgi:two-component system OmpR family response regulator